MLFLKLQRIHVGLWFSRDGKIFKTERTEGKNELELVSLTGKMFFKVIPEMSDTGYLFVRDKDIPKPGSGSSTIIVKEKEVYGKYVHQMMVFTFGDKDGRPYKSVGVRNIIDHIDMNHEHNNIENLQLVSYGINLFRAYYKTKNRLPSGVYKDNCSTRFKDYYNSLDEIDKKILDIEIELDLQGKY